MQKYAGGLFQNQQVMTPPPPRKGLSFFSRSAPTLLAGIAMVLFFTGCSSAPEAPQEHREIRNKAGEYAMLGNGYFRQADYEMALRFFELALQENTIVDHLPGIVKSRNSIAKVYIAAGKYDAAERELTLALQIADGLPEPELESQSLILLGEISMHRGQNTVALEYLTEAQVAREKNQLENDSVLLHNLGTVHARLGEYDQAERYLQQALELNLDANDWTKTAGNYYMLSSVASRKGNTSSALTLMTEALEYDKRAENSVGIAADLTGLGRIHEKTGDWEQAYEFYTRALRIYAGLNLASQVEKTLISLEQAARATDRDDEARQFAQERDRILQKMSGSSDQ